MMNKIAFYLFTLFFLISGCRTDRKRPSEEQIIAINLKRGPIIYCGSPEKQFGKADFKISCEEASEDFTLAIKLLHSFEYDEAEKAFAAVIAKTPDCAMAYWGVAMSNFHPLWTPPTEAELKKGSNSIAIAQSLESTSKESAYIDAIAAFYKDWENSDHRTRCLKFEKGMEMIHSKYPDDKEAAIFYALALNAAADPNDKTFERQKKAGVILKSLYPRQPDHPGILHYLIHIYDSPELASEGLDAARKYSKIAPSSAHALHMPSHIFIRLGLWDESIRSNLESVASAKCYAETAGMKGHWDEELHGMDYLVYAYLQKGKNDSAKKQIEYLKTITVVEPVNFKVAYAYAAIPSRYLLENKLWNEASKLELNPKEFPWKNFPWQQAIIHFTRLLGNVHVGNVQMAEEELKELYVIHDSLAAQKDIYKANQVEIQIKTSEALLKMKQGKKEEALILMKHAADMEDKTEKHPVTPGEVIPASEILGDMLMELKKPAEALIAYESDLKKHPNRLNAVRGAALAADKSGETQKAKYYSKQLRITDYELRMND